MTGFYMSQIVIMEGTSEKTLIAQPSNFLGKANHVLWISNF